MSFFFDSYAVIEIIKLNPSYIKYGDSTIVITLFNLIEITNSVFLDFGEERAKDVYGKFKGCVQKIDENIVIEAIKLRQKYKKRNLSHADCIGYCYALQKGLRFLTGDKEFSDLPNVEFIKK